MNFSLFDVLRINNHFSKREDNNQTRQAYLNGTTNFEIYNSIMCYLKTNSHFLKEKANGFPFSESREDLFDFLLKQMDLEMSYI